MNSYKGAKENVPMLIFLLLLYPDKMSSDKGAMENNLIASALPGQNEL